MYKQVITYSWAVNPLILLSQCDQATSAKKRVNCVIKKSVGKKTMRLQDLTTEQHTTKIKKRKKEKLKKTEI
jgi:hypothetical protein